MLDAGNEGRNPVVAGMTTFDPRQELQSMTCCDCAIVILLVAAVCAADELATHGPAFVRGMFSCEDSIIAGRGVAPPCRARIFSFPCFFPCI
jgi:hypothetical protein